MTTLKSFILVSFIVLAAVPLYSQAPPSPPEAMVTLQVLGEDGTPIIGAAANVTFLLPGRGTPTKLADGLTDREGKFSARSPAIEDVSYGAIKEGYHRTIGKPFDLTEEQNDHWLPWNPTLPVVLKKIVNPVPMYAKRTRVGIPVENKPIGFDLQESDWVAPHGKGRVADFVFLLSRRFAGPKDYEARLRLTFSNEGDGIQPVFAADRYSSELRLPHNAPADGYQPVWERSDSYSNPAPTRDDQNYFFRIRSQGQKALYGKIHGEIRAVGYRSAMAGVAFVYYLNPDGTRNVEFNPKRNLFNNLKLLEQVQQP